MALAAFLFVSCFSGEVSDSDTFWHLATGRYIVANHRLPVPDPFAWGTYLGKPAYPEEPVTRNFNLTHEWLAQVVLYSVFAIGGFPGMVLFRALLMTTVGAGLGLLVWRRTGLFYHSLLAPLLLLWVQYDDPVGDRPILFTLLFLMAALLVLEWRRRLWFLVPLFLLWGNAHGGYIMGWAVLGAYCAEDLWLLWRRTPAGDSRKLWVWCGAAVLASGLNPNGFRAVQVLLLYGKSALQARLIEWTPPALWPPEEAFTIVLWLAAGLLLWARRRARPADWFVYLFFAAAAARASRNVVFVGIVGGYVIAVYLPWRRLLPAAGQYAVAAVLCGACVYQTARGHAFELRAGEWRYPAGAATFLRQHHVRGRMYNIYGAGGYLMWRLWPQLKVMIDGRALNESVNRDAYRIVNSNLASDGLGKGYNELLDDYGVDIIVAEGFEYYTGNPWWLAVNLATMPQDTWKLVYRDPSSVVFMRQPPPGVRPLDPREAILSFEDQCTMHLERDPRRPGCAAGLARVYAGLGDTARAKHWGLIWLEREPNPDPASVQALQQLR